MVLLNRYKFDNYYFDWPHEFSRFFEIRTLVSCYSTWRIVPFQSVGDQIAATTSVLFAS